MIVAFLHASLLQKFYSVYLESMPSSYYTKILSISCQTLQCFGLGQRIQFFSSILCKTFMQIFASYKNIIYELGSGGTCL